MLNIDIIHQNDTFWLKSWVQFLENRAVMVA